MGTDKSFAHPRWQMWTTGCSCAVYAYTDYHRGHKDLLNCHWGGDFLDECLTAVLGCLLRYPKPSLAYLADRYHKPCTSQVGEFKVVLPFPSGTGSLPKYWECAGPFYWTWSLRGVVAVPLVRIGGGWGALNSKKKKKKKRTDASGLSVDASGLVPP